jgi:hypothetical protein
MPVGEYQKWKKISVFPILMAFFLIPEYWLKAKFRLQFNACVKNM